MSTFVSDTAVVRLPDWVTDLGSFRRWLDSDQVAEHGRYGYLNGEIWIDMSKEQFFSHNQVKQEYALVLGRIAKQERRGRYIPDGMLLTHMKANLSSQPDGTFVANEGFAKGRVRLFEGARDGFVELEGAPDMVLEVISDSSVEKDTIVLFDLYWRAGVAEYWLVDARGDQLDFHVFWHSDEGFVESPTSRGWAESRVFQRSFRLTRENDTLGHPEFSLEVQ